MQVLLCTKVTKNLTNINDKTLLILYFFVQV